MSVRWNEGIFFNHILFYIYRDTYCRTYIYDYIQKALTKILQSKFVHVLEGFGAEIKSENPCDGESLERFENRSTTVIVEEEVFKCQNRAQEDVNHRVELTTVIDVCCIEIVPCKE